MLIATILTAITCTPIDFDYEPKDGDSESLSAMPNPPLVHWSKERWDELLTTVMELKDLLPAKEDRKLELVCRTIRLHATLSPIRLTIEKEIKAKESGPVVIEKTLVEAYA